MRFYIPFELPSKGKLITPYKGEIGDAEGLEQLERATPGINQDQIIAELIQKALKEQYWDVRDLTGPDFMYLKVMYSLATYGNKLLYPVICPYCGHENKFISLKDLKKIEYKDQEIRIKKIPAQGTRDFYAEDGDEIEIRIPTISERWEVLEQGDKPYATTKALLSAINKVNGKSLNSIEKELYIQELSTVQKRVILARVDKLVDYGIAMYQDMVCEECSKTISYPFHVTSSQLFFPTLA